MDYVPYRRMATLAISLGSMLTPAMASNPKSKETVFIINNNDFVAGDIFFDVSGKWIGVWQSKDQFWVAPVRVKRPVYNVVNPEPEDLPERSSPRFSPKRPYLFCVKGISWFPRKTTKLPSAQIKDSKISIYAKGTFRSMAFSIETTSKLENDPGGHLLLTIDNATQITSSYFSYFTLLWAGDIDGDGKLDFVIGNEKDSGGSSISLYLSSFAKHGELVGFAAVCGSSGC